MDTQNSFRIGKNLLTLTSTSVLLQKTTRNKFMLIFLDFFIFAVLVTVVTIIVKTNQSFYQPDFVGWLCLGALVIVPMYFLSTMFRSTFNECKNYSISQNDGKVVLNGRHFELHQTNLVVKKRVGWQGLGLSYEIQSKSQQKNWS